jgi:ABC-type uncharacterized transport system substrate-binding protein
MATLGQGRITHRSAAILAPGMRRRELITLLGGVVAVLPLAARAQQPTVPVIGFLGSASPGPYAPFVAGFRQGLNEAGFVEGRNVTIVYRWAEGQYDRLPAMVSYLVSRQVAVIIAEGGPAAMAAKPVTTIPIVFTVGYDPISAGLVASLNRPGGNKTGLSLFAVSLVLKRLELMRELVPTATLIALLLNPKNRNADALSSDARDAARSVNQQIEIVNAASDAELELAFERLSQLGAGALLVAADPFFSDRRERLIELAAQYHVPANYELREFVAAGGLMSYGASLGDSFRQVGIYAGRILKGTQPTDLPVLQPTTFELVINLKTAKALGLTVPPSLLARADEVIE